MNYSNEEERAQIKADIMDAALEKFFNNVLDCIIFEETSIKF